MGKIYTPMAGRTLTDLYEDIYEYLFTFLNTIELMKLSRTCKVLRNTVMRKQRYLIVKIGRNTMRLIDLRVYHDNTPIVLRKLPAYHREIAPMPVKNIPPRIIQKNIDMEMVYVCIVMFIISVGIIIIIVAAFF